MNGVFAARLVAVPDEDHEHQNRDGQGPGQNERVAPVGSAAIQQKCEERDGRQKSDVFRATRAI